MLIVCLQASLWRYLSLVSSLLCCYSWIDNRFSFLIFSIAGHNSMKGLLRPSDLLVFTLCLLSSRAIRIRNQLCLEEPVLLHITFLLCVWSLLGCSSSSSVSLLSQRMPVQWKDFFMSAQVLVGHPISCLALSFTTRWVNSSRHVSSHHSIDWGFIR
jgi:hypothetical protein